MNFYVTYRHLDFFDDLVIRLHEKCEFPLFTWAIANTMYIKMATMKRRKLY